MDTSRSANAPEDEMWNGKTEFIHAADEANFLVPTVIDVAIPKDRCCPCNYYRFKPIQGPWQILLYFPFDEQNLEVANPRVFDQ